jgi:hypothetical protein
MRMILLVGLLAMVTVAQSQSFRGDIVGRVSDSKTHEPIPYVNVVVLELENVGTAADEEGNFIIRGLEVGTYSLRISALGYATRIVTNVVVTTGRATPLSIKLDETILQMDEIKVQASYFDRADQMSPISSNVIGRSEVLRSPGGVQDVQRVVQNLPGVASSTDNINELIVRGGAPFENLTILDHMEVHSINHYSNQFNSAGPINMVNADMIEDAHFSTGGFPARYGDKVSSVLDLTVREGNRSTPFASKTAFNMAGIGTLLEGGFAAGRGSYILSVRNSLLEMLDRIVGISSLSLTAIPRYWDAQAKIAYDLTPTDKAWFNLLYGDSRISIAGEFKERDLLRAGTIDSSSVTNLSPITKQYASGVSWRHLFGKKGYSIATVYGAGVITDFVVHEDFTRRVRDSQGNVTDYTILNSRLLFSNVAYESFVAAKYELFYQIDDMHDLSIGGQVQTSASWKNDVYLVADTLRFDLNGDGMFETGPIVIPPYSFHQRYGFADASKYFLYASDRIRLSSVLVLTVGLRYDHFTYSRHGYLAPRASLMFRVIPPTTSLTIAAGRYYQTQPFPYYSDRRNLGYNKHLPHLMADHYVLGIEHIFDRGLKMSVETYYKRYENDAVSEQFVYSADPTFWSDRYLAIGERRSYGLEFFLEQKQVEDVFGVLSVSLSRSWMRDPRRPPRGRSFASDYDYPVIVTALAGKVVKGVRDWLDKTPFFVKYPSYILPFSNEMELSFRYRYQSGRPYTPREYGTWKQVREGGVKWSKGSWITSDAANGARYPHYSRLDLQWISRFYFNRWNINVYISLQNVLNRKNVFFENYRSDGTRETVYQFTFLPVAGLEVEF